MTLSLPAKVVACKKETATVEMNGAPLRVRRGTVTGLTPGCWVLIGDDTILSIITEDEVQSRQKLWSELVEITTNAL